MVSESTLFQNTKRFSLYVHVPFCSVRCHYCDFYSKAGFREVERFVSLLQEEVRLAIARNPQLSEIPVETIFVGGGTPSALSAEQWTQISDVLHQNFSLSEVKEWTIECNPETFSDAKAEAWLASGVNRVSFGVQSLNDKELEGIGRIHNAEKVRELLRNPILKRFDSINCDVIYGLPFATVASVSQTVKELSSFAVVKHISAYELTIAEGTALAMHPEKYELPSEEVVEDQVEAVRSFLEVSGYERYEVSNFAQKGHHCLHNKRYWDLSPYLGLGPSAHSFDGSNRFSNPSSLELYGKSLGEKNLPWVVEEDENGLDEYLFLRLRTSEGILLEDFKERFGSIFTELVHSEKLQMLIDEGYLCMNATHCALVEGKLDVADGVTLQLISD